MIRISALKDLPKMAQGYVRDITVRWALEELELPYEVRLVGADELKSPEYLRLQPFGQVPSFEDDGTVIFESAAIVLHLAQKSTKLMPVGVRDEAQVQAWMFAAMNTLDPLVRNFEQIEYFHPEAEWSKLRRPAAVDALEERLDQLIAVLRRHDYIAGIEFTAADILLTMVLRILGESELYRSRTVLVEYVHRCESRHAFKKAMHKHLAAYEN